MFPLLCLGSGAARHFNANREALGKGTPGYFYDPVYYRSTAAATTAPVEAAASAVSRTVLEDTVPGS